MTTDDPIDRYNLAFDIDNMQSVCRHCHDGHCTATRRNEPMGIVGLNLCDSSAFTTHPLFTRERKFLNFVRLRKNNNRNGKGNKTIYDGYQKEAERQ